MNPIALSLIGSYRLRSGLLWLAHRPGWDTLPLAIVGALVVTHTGVPAVLMTTAAPLTVALILAAAVGRRLHRELDEFGVPCRWCETECEMDEITEGDSL